MSKLYRFFPSAQKHNIIILNTMFRDCSLKTFSQKWFFDYDRSLFLSTIVGKVSKMVHNNKIPYKFKNNTFSATLAGKNK